ncbi:hypothetical protein [Dankookia sp. P2]|uniref:hypothetical protein n=1 Tax=Dankookia sp. P2 TaxID=3423955 RepID=UPI003D670159
MPSQKSQAPRRTPPTSATATPPMMKGRPAGWGGDSTSRRLRPRDMGAVYGVFTPIGQAGRVMQPLIVGPFAVTRDGALQPREASPPCPALFLARPVLRSRGGGRWPAYRGHRRPHPLDRRAGRRPTHRLRDGGDAARTLPPGWRVQLLPDHRIRLEAATDRAEPQTATSVIAAMVRFALVLDPYLDRLDSASAGPSGKLNSCPG